MKRFIKLTIELMLTLVFVLSMCACNESRQVVPGEGEYRVFYINNQATEIKSMVCKPVKTAKAELVSELIGQMERNPESNELFTCVTSDVEILSALISDRTLTLNFSDKYNSLSPTREVLTRAAFVRTLTQVDGIDYVRFTINDEELYNRTGDIVGLMTGDMFIDNEGKEINTYDVATFILYYANDDGTGLISVSKTVEYSSSVALEKVVADQIMKGPDMGAAGKPTMNPDSQILNVTVKDGTCYINLDEAFLNQTYAVNPDVAVYSLVNSLTELNYINKVQILVNGESKVTYRDTMPLDEPFTRNLDLLEGEG